MQRSIWQRITKATITTLIVILNLALVVGAVCCFGYHYSDWFPFLRHYYEDPLSKEFAHHWLPSPEHGGLGGLSYLSVTTGLNLAMVKFEVFKKSLKDVEAQWKEEIDAQLGDAYADAKADDVHRGRMRAALESHVKDRLQDSYEKHRFMVLCWRAVAIPLVIVGLAALFFQFSAGAGGVIFVVPVLGAWVAKLFCKWELSREVRTLVPFAKRVADDLKNQQAALQAEVNSTVADEFHRLTGPQPARP